MRYLNVVLALFLCGGASALAQSGVVRSANQPIPGATVTVTQGNRTLSTVTDAEGHYVFPSLRSGTWAVTVEMFGFSTLKKDVDYASANGPVDFDLQLKPSMALQRFSQYAGRRAPTSGTGPADSGPQIDQILQSETSTQQQGFPANGAGSEGSNETFLVSGSLSPGMAQGSQADSGPDTRFAGRATGEFGGPGELQAAPNAPGFEGQGGGGGFGGRGGFGARGGFGGGRGGRSPGRAGATQFGNHRRRNQQIHGMLSFTLQNSVLNAKPFSLNGLDVPQAAYAQSRFSLIVGGPLLIPKIVKDPKTQFFVTYFGTRGRTPELFTETVPTAAERSGDFSQATQLLGTSAAGVPVSIYNPATRQPFPGNSIPSSMLNPIALGLLRFYPLPNQPGAANNYQLETTQAGNSDNAGLRIQRNLTSADRLSLNLHYQRRDGTTVQPFGYADTTNGYGVNARLQWTRNLSAKAISNSQVQFNRNDTEIVPYFSLLPDVAAELGIEGTSANPLDYGPPTLNFTNFGALSDSAATLHRNQSQGVTESITLLKGLHTVTLGGGYTRADLSARTDPNGRGTFNFTGLATSSINGKGQPAPGTGYDLADFLLGLPQSSSIQYSQFSQYFLQNQANGFAQDEWKARSDLTLTMGVRYEYFSPLNEKYGRLANLDIAPGFTNVAVVTPNTPGPYTGAFPSGLIDPDLNNWSPRIGLAWKVPKLKRSTIVRAGYGIYYNGQAYIPFAASLANQPPFAVASSVNTSAANVLTLKSGLTKTAPDQVTNTFAVDRNYRTPYAGTWNASIQHELGGGFFAEIGYLGTKGTRLDVRTLPNELPPGSARLFTQRTQFGNATGFTYDQSEGNSIFNALQLRLMRRFHRGLSVNAFYQFAKSIDDSSTFGGAGNTVAQNWLDLAAERGLSSFDVRHELTANFVWTSPVAGPGSRFAPDGKLGRLLKDWTLSGGLTGQTGNPLTARILGNTQRLAQTGGVGSGRAEATGLPVEEGSGFFNLDAFTSPPPGEYGNAGRNTIPGPGLISLNLAFARSFTLAERRRLEFRLEANNVLNHVNYTSFYTVVNAVNYGLPSAAGSMRSLQAVARFRF